MNKDYIFGIRAAIEALEAGKEINKVLIQKGLQSPLIPELRKALNEVEAPIQYVPVEKLNRITMKNHQGVIAFISPIQYGVLSELVPNIYETGESPLLVMLDRVTDVRNFGAIARSAECFGAHGIVTPIKGAAQINAEAVKTSAGALNSLPVCRERFLQDAIAFCKQSGIKVVGCTEKTSTEIADVEMSGPTCLVMGSEFDGISPAIMELCDELGKIPITGAIESLNVSVSAGIALYEAKRQRNG